MCKRDNSHFLRYVLISPKLTACAGHNSHTVGDNLIIFDRHIHVYQVK